jgi:hypothetical protein
MKNIFFVCMALLLFMLGCRVQEPVKNITKEPKPDPVDFEWIKQSEEIKLHTANIYFIGKAEGKYVENGKWVGKITGDVFCKPTPEKFLKSGIYIQNCTIQVNEDYSIKVVAPEDLIIVAGKKITFEDGETVLTGNTDTFRCKTNGMMTIFHTYNKTDISNPSSPDR